MLRGLGPPLLSLMIGSDSELYNIDW